MREVKFYIRNSSIGLTNEQQKMNDSDVSKIVNEYVKKNIKVHAIRRDSSGDVYEIVLKVD